MKMSQQLYECRCPYLHSALGYRTEFLNTFGKIVSNIEAFEQLHCMRYLSYQPGGFLYDTYLLNVIANFLPKTRIHAGFAEPLYNRLPAIKDAYHELHRWATIQSSDITLSCSSAMRHFSNQAYRTHIAVMIDPDPHTIPDFDDDGWKKIFFRYANSLFEDGAYFSTLFFQPIQHIPYRHMIHGRYYTTSELTICTIYHTYGVSNLYENSHVRLFINGHEIKQFGSIPHAIQLNYSTVYTLENNAKYQEFITLCNELLTKPLVKNARLENTKVLPVPAMIRC